MAVSSSEPPAYASTMELNFSPRPVSVTTPTMMPADAQVAATFSTPSEPPSSAFTSPEFQNPFSHGSRPWNHSYGMSAESRWKKEKRNVATVAKNTDITG